MALRVGPDDTFELKTAAGEPLITFALDGAPVEPTTRMPTRVWEILGHYALTPPPAAVDLYRVAAAVYGADLRVPRSTAFDRWSRDIVLHIPVADVTTWAAARDALHSLLGFLTGDRWTVEFREQPVPAPPRDPRHRGELAPFRADAATLFSGGLDSAVGALDALGAGRALALVSHNSKGGDSFSSPAQREVLRAVRQRYPDGEAHWFRFRVDPPPIVPGVSASETTTRSRSIIFLALGVLVATALDAGGIAPGAPLIVPENGLISLNVPLTRARYGAWSTRTTHPHTLALLREVLAAVGLGTAFEVPYQYATKGEMLARAAAPGATGGAAARVVAAVTVSCGHPNQGRFLPRERVLRADGTRRQHCGTCVPCIIRRASMRHVGWDDPDDYWFDVPRELSALRLDRAGDARAFLLAFEGRRPARASTLLRSGPIPVTDAAAFDALLRVYDAGMDEVEAFLTGA